MKTFCCIQIHLILAPQPSSQGDKTEACREIEINILASMSDNPMIFHPIDIKNVYIYKYDAIVHLAVFRAAVSQVWEEEIIFLFWGNT